MYSPTGQLTRKTDPRGPAFTRVYDAEFRLTDPEVGHGTYSSSSSVVSLTIEMRTAEGNFPHYEDSDRASGFYSFITDEAGGVRAFSP